MDPARQLQELGWCVLPGLIPAERIAAARASRLWGVTGSGERVTNAWRYDDAVRDLAVDRSVRDVLFGAFERRPIPFQTLNFRVGTQQSLHADSIHFDSIPAGRVAAAWVALEDVGKEQGPVILVPRSHLLPRIGPEAAVDPEGRFDYSRYEEIIAERVRGMEIVHIEAAAGDVLLWDGNLVHGGSPDRLDGSTRLSQVTHYFFEGCVYVTPMRSAPESGEYMVRDPLIDIGTRRRVRHTLDGRPVRLVHQPNGRTRILNPSDPNTGLLEFTLSAGLGLERRIHQRVVSALRSRAGRRLLRNGPME